MPDSPDRSEMTGPDCALRSSAKDRPSRYWRIPQPPLLPEMGGGGESRVFGQYGVPRSGWPVVSAESSRRCQAPRRLWPVAKGPTHEEPDALAGPRRSPTFGVLSDPWQIHQYAGWTSHTLVCVKTFPI